MTIECHAIDMSNDRANIAYAGQTPWHRLGARLDAGADLDTWAAAAGLDHQVHVSPVEYEAEGERKLWAERAVLYRSDTRVPLSVMSKRYNVVQPREVLDFFDRLVRRDGLTIETAGCLHGGRQVWALAKLGDAAPVIDADLVAPYVLMATSYDGTMSTLVRYTTIRVVCHNTMRMAHSSHGEAIRVEHSKVFDASRARIDLGLAADAFERTMIEMRLLAERPVSDSFAGAMLADLLPKPYITELVNGKKQRAPQPPETGRGYQKIMALFKGEAKGAELPGVSGTAWGLLNAITEYTDWHRSSNDDARIRSAWFGTSDALKERARDALIRLA